MPEFRHNMVVITDFVRIWMAISTETASSWGPPLSSSKVVFMLLLIITMVFLCCSCFHRLPQFEISSLQTKRLPRSSRPELRAPYVQNNTHSLHLTGGKVTLSHRQSYYGDEVDIAAVQAALELPQNPDCNSQ